MIDTRASELVPFQMEHVQELIRSRGPCLTVTLPPFHPGEPAKSRAAVLKTMIQEAARRLENGKVLPSVGAALLAPLDQMADQEATFAGSQLGQVIFRAPELFEQFALIEPPTQSLSLASHFQIRPFLLELNCPREFYLLELSAKQAALCRGNRLQLTRCEWPKGVPETLEAAMAFRQPDHDLMNRSTAGSSLGAMKGVRFTTSADRETHQAHLADFYRILDRAVSEITRGRTAPLILSGVDEDTSLFRSVSSYPNLCRTTISGSPGIQTSKDDLKAQCYAILRSESLQSAGESLAQSREVMAPARFSTDSDTILNAAFDGRVSRLYINQDASWLGFARTSQRLLGSEDLYNVAVIETLRDGGAAFSLPAEYMLGQTSMAGILRY